MSTETPSLAAPEALAELTDEALLDQLVHLCGHINAADFRLCTLIQELDVRNCLGPVRMQRRAMAQPPLRHRPGSGAGTHPHIQGAGEAAACHRGVPGRRTQLLQGARHHPRRPPRQRGIAPQRRPLHHRRPERAHLPQVPKGRGLAGGEEELRRPQGDLLPRRGRLLGHPGQAAAGPRSAGGEGDPACLQRHRSRTWRTVRTAEGPTHSPTWPSTSSAPPKPRRPRPTTTIRWWCTFPRKRFPQHLPEKAQPEGAMSGAESRGRRCHLRPGGATHLLRLRHRPAGGVGRRAAGLWAASAA